MTRVVEAALAAPRATIALWLVILVLAGVGIPMTTAEVGYRILLGEDHPSIVRIDEFIDRYGGGLPVIVAWECGPAEPCESALDVASLEMALGIEEALRSEPSIKEIVSPASMPLLLADDGDIAIRRLTHEGEAVSDLDVLSEMALRDPAWVGTVVNQDGSAGAILMQTSSADSAAMQALVVALFDALEPFEARGFNFHPVGDPIDFVVAGGEMKAETPRIIPILVILLSIIAYLLLRSVTAVALSLAVAGAALITALGLMGWLGWPEVEWTQALPPFILVAGFCNSVHLLSYLSTCAHERSGATLEQDEILSAADHVAQGCLLASVTTALAVLSFIFSGFASFSQFGVIAAVGVCVSLLFTFSALPILLTFVPRYALVAETTGQRWVAFLEELVGIASRRRWIIIGASGALLCLSMFGISMLTIDIDERALLGRESKVVMWANWVEDHLRKADGLELEIVLPEAESLDVPENLLVIEELVTKLNAHPRLADGWSIVDLIKSANRAMHDDDEDYFRVGENQAENSALLMLLGMGSARAVDAWLTIDHRRVRASFAADPMAMNERTQVLSDVRDTIRDHLPPNWEFSLTGPLEVYAVFVHEIQRTQLSSFLTAAAAIGIVLCIYFWSTGSRLMWSLRWSLAALLVSAFPVALTLGTMGLLEIPLDAGTAMVGAIVLGVAVDDSVHLIVLYRRNRLMGATAQASIAAAVHGSGRALVTTSAALSVGFFALLMSSWSSIASFGLLSGVAVICALVADLVILPAMVVAMSGGDTISTPLQRDSEPRDSTRSTMLAVMLAAAGLGVLAPQFVDTGWLRSGSRVCDVFPSDSLLDYPGFAQRCQLNLPSLGGRVSSARKDSAIRGRDSESAAVMASEQKLEPPANETRSIHDAVGFQEHAMWIPTAIAAAALILGASVVRYSVASAAIPFGLLSSFAAICGFFRIVGGANDLHPAPEFLAYALLWAPLVHLSLSYPVRHQILRRVPALPSVIYWSSLVVVVPTMIGYWRIPELFLASRVLASALILFGVALLVGSMLRSKSSIDRSDVAISGRRPLLVSIAIAAGCLAFGMSGKISGAAVVGAILIATPIPIGVSLLMRTGHENRSIVFYGMAKGAASLAVAVFGILAAISMSGRASDARSLTTFGVVVLLAFLLHDAVRQVARRWLVPMLDTPDWSSEVIGAEFAACVRRLSTGDEVCFELVVRIHRYLKPGGVLVIGEDGAVRSSMGASISGSMHDFRDSPLSEIASSGANEPARDAGTLSRHEDGESIDMVLSGETQREGRVTLVVLARADRTPYSNAERSLVATMMDVAAVALDRADLAEHIRREERYETIGRVGAGLMHDIGRRATSITQRARDLTATEGLAQQERIEAVRIEAMADEIADCVDRLARFPEAGAERGEGRWPLIELVDAAVCSTRHMHPGARIAVDADLGSASALAPDDLRLALINVLDNAVRASGQGAEVSVAVRGGREEVCLEVRDRGAGMTGEEQSRAFDAFWTTRPDGSGLGLASVRNTLRRLGGSVSLESEVGQGTRVRMAWPADADVAVAS